MAQILWQVQDLREQLILAEAEQVKLERHIREVVRDPVNRQKTGFAPFYTDPADAIDALRAMGRLAYLVRPGMKNRVKPEVLLGWWETAANKTEILRSQLARLEEAMAEAGIPPLR